MIELHGWVTIWESYKVDHEEGNLFDLTENIKQEIECLNWNSGLLLLDYYNGTPVLTIALLCNRYNQQVAEVFHLLEYISSIAVGSYGIVYLHDDEDIHGKENDFQVYVLARGKVEKKDDPLLSPLIPKVEDPC